MTSTTVQTQTSVLSDELLARFHERAPVYDRENRFFFEDFEELREVGYLKAAVPTELGGLGLRLAEVCQEQRRLGYWAPATAVAINMHLYWTGVAADLWRAGDTSLEWILRGAANGDVFAAGHAEGGNDIPLIYSTTRAERVDGGYRFTGRKSFGSLTPVWTYLGLHGMISSGNGTEDAQIVHAFMPRSSEGYTIEETWDTLGMRATRSDDTLLNNVFVPDEHVVRVLPAGFAGADAFVLTVFAWFLLGIGNCYYGLAQRTLDLTLEGVKRKSSLAMSRSMDHHAGVQFAIADMVTEMEATGPLLDRVAQDWTDGVDHGGHWLVKLLSAKYKAVEGAWRVVDTAFELGGGFGIFKKNEIERLFRDARLGRIHPANSSLTRELVAKTVLGIHPDSTPRWG